MVLEVLSFHWVLVLLKVQHHLCHQQVQVVQQDPVVLVIQCHLEVPEDPADQVCLVFLVIQKVPMVLLVQENQNLPLALELQDFLVVLEVLNHPCYLQGLVYQLVQCYQQVQADLLLLVRELQVHLQDLFDPEFLVIQLCHLGQELHVVLVGQHCLQFQGFHLVQAVHLDQ